MTPTFITRAAVIGTAALLISSVSASPAAQAAPFSPAGLELQQAPELVETVQYRRRPARRVVRRRGNNAAAGAALAIGILGAAAAIAATQQRAPRYREPEYYYQPQPHPGYVYGPPPVQYYQPDPGYVRQQQWQQRRAYEAQVRAQQRAQWQAQQNYGNRYYGPRPSAERTQRETPWYAPPGAGQPQN